jgi:hypothetical protein
MKVAALDRVKFSGDSKIKIKFFVIGYSNIPQCSTCGSIHTQFIKPSFRAIQARFYSALVESDMDYSSERVNKFNRT